MYRRAGVMRHNNRPTETHSNYFNQAYRLNWTIELLDQSTYFQDYYIKPWTRAPPAFIGMALAIVWYHFYRPVVASSGAGGNVR